MAAARHRRHAAPHRRAKKPSAFWLGRLASGNRGLLWNRESDPSMWNGSLDVVYFIPDQHLQAAVTCSAVRIANQFRLQISGCYVGRSWAAPTSLAARFTLVHTNGG